MKIRRLASFLFLYFYSLVSSIYLFTTGIINHGNRELIKRIGVHFGFHSVLAGLTSPLLPVADIRDLIDMQDEIIVREPVPADGNVTAFELNVINLLVKNYRPRRIFEIGTFDGRTTLNLAVHGDEDGSVFTLDLPPEKAESAVLKDFWRDRKYVMKPESGSRFKSSPEAEKITQLYGDSADFDFGPYYDSMDFIFIDGSHAAAYVENDTLTALKLLREGKGIIVWHDYRPLSQVARVLNRMCRRIDLLRGTVHIKNSDLACLILHH